MDKNQAVLDLLNPYLYNAEAQATEQVIRAVAEALGFKVEFLPHGEIIIKTGISPLCVGDKVIVPESLRHANRPNWTGKAEYGTIVAWRDASKLVAVVADKRHQGFDVETYRLTRCTNFTEED